jgi:hypothetical protein
MSKNQSKPESRKGPRRSRWRRLLRLLVGTALVLCLLSATALLLVTRSWFIVSQLKPELERRLGGEVTIGRAEYQGDGRVVFTNLKLRARSIAGEAGQIASIGRATVRVDLRKLFSGGLSVDDVEVDDALLRLSEDSRQGGELNVMALAPAWPSGSGKDTPVPPRVRIRRAALEFGSHSGARYETLGRRLMSGEMYPTAAADGWYNFELAEVDEFGRSIGPDGVFIKGEWNPATNEQHSRIDGIELDQRVYWMCPQKARLMWDRMDLEGKVDGVIVHWHPDRPFLVEFKVKDVALTLPIETKNLWARYHEGKVAPTASRPRMHVNNGTIRLGSDSVELENLAGELSSEDTHADLVGVPYNISFTMSSFPTIDWNNREQWMEQVLTTAPFELTFRINEFGLERSEAGEAPALDLPVLVAKVLAKFQVTDWVLSTSVGMTRAAPTVDEAGRLIAADPVTTGQAYIRKASGKYTKFPYPLDDVNAYLEFDNEKVTVHYLTGKGSGESEFRIEGYIAPPDNDAAVALTLRGTNVPVDDRLRGALKANELEAFDALFNRPAYESMAQAGLVPDKAALDAAEAQRAAALERAAQLRQSSSDDPNMLDEIDRLEREAVRLDRSIAAGPFQLGGIVDLDLKIDRELGDKKPTVTTGKITLQSIGVMYENFPYPLRVTGGVLDWQKDRITVAAGPTGDNLPIVGAGGGSGMVTGELLFPKLDGKRKVRPNLTITVDDDEINAAVYAAIPMSKPERERRRDEALKWPGGALSKAASLVQGIGLIGACNYRGVINTGDDGKVDYDFTLTMADGTAQPNQQLANAIGAHGEPWPAGLVLNHVHGSLNVRRDAINWNNITGTSGASGVVANGSIDLSDSDHTSDISIDFQHLPVDRYVLNLVNPEHAQRAQELWTRFSPQGSFDARFEYQSHGDASSKIMRVEPHEITALVGPGRVTFNRVEGGLTFDALGVGFDKLRLTLKNQDGHDGGEFLLDSQPSATIGAEHREIRGRWTKGRFDSPIVSDAIELFGSPQEAETYRRHNAAGQFDSEFRVRLPGGSVERDYEIVVRPSTVDCDVNGTPIKADIDEGAITLRPHAIEVAGVRGRHAGGNFAVDGRIETQGSTDVTLHVNYAGLIRSSQFEAFLPLKAREALDAIKFDDGGPTTIADLDLHLTQALGPDSDSKWRSEIAGHIRTKAASLVAGVEFSDLDGQFDLHVLHAPGAPLQLDILAHAKQATVLGQKLTNLEAPITLSDDGQVIRVPSLRADAHQGAVSAEAWSGVGDNREYQATIEMIGVPLQGFLKKGADGGSESASDHVPQGEVYSHMSLAGVRDEPQSRRGRGVVRVLRGDMAAVPLALQLMQLFQLTFPFSGGLDYADAQMYLVGDRVFFERIVFESSVGGNAMLQLFGEGEMNFDTLELNTRFHSRSGIAILRDVVGAVGDRLYEIEVTGTLSEPKTRVVPLPD